MAAALDDPLDLALLNDWQRGFPLQSEPFAAIGAALGVDAAAVIERYRALQARGALSRIGGAFGAGAGGAALLCALAVPPARLEAVAAIVSAHPGVNHNYEREHERNLWFVITGGDAAAVAEAVDALEAACGLRALRLPMQRAYRIDLGFDLRRALAARGPRVRPVAAPVLPQDRALAACVEHGLPRWRGRSSPGATTARAARPRCWPRCSAGWRRARCAASAPSCAITRAASRTTR